jgi:hypothetical protein
MYSSCGTMPSSDGATEVGLLTLGTAVTMHGLTQSYTMGKLNRVGEATFHREEKNGVLRK